MVLWAEKLRDISFSSLMTVYEEGNRENAAEFWPHLEERERMIQAEQEFYQYLKQIFFPTENARYCILVEQGSYVSALRLEPYRDGLLLEALETAPDQRHADLRALGDLARAALPETGASDVEQRQPQGGHLHEITSFHFRNLFLAAI